MYECGTFFDRQIEISLAKCLKKAALAKYTGSIHEECQKEIEKQRKPQTTTGSLYVSLSMISNKETLTFPKITLKHRKGKLRLKTFST